jgi:DsbC/DsbD-like thiol-disulfide interchange protein
MLACSHPAPRPPVYSKASLIIEQSAVTPGSHANIGIRFVTDNGWHIYWQNPGDSGEPPRIKWQLPAGVTAGALQWPMPMLLTTPAGTDYGYNGTTVLLSTLQVPANAQPGAIDVGGDLRWLVCRDICVPQRTELKASVRIASATIVDNAARQLLESAASRIPKPLPATFQPVATELPDSFRLTLVSAEPITQARFFPIEEEQVDNGAPQELTSKAGTMSLKLNKSQYLRQDHSRIGGVIILNGHDAYNVDVPIQSPPAQKGSHRK